MSFGPVRVQQDFITADQFTAPQLTTEGGTPMGEAIMEALDLVKLRKQRYQANGVPITAPGSS